MKKPLNSGEFPAISGEKSKRRKLEQPQEKREEREGGGEEDETAPPNTAFVDLNEDLLFEVLKHADSRTLASAACVSKRWQKTARDERLWEMICTRHGANVGCGALQLRSVVLALGGFRRLYALFLWPLLKCPSLTTSSPSPSPSSSSSPLSPSISSPPAVPSKSATSSRTRWGKDEVHLSLCLLSIRFYEKMNYKKQR